jgi:hypothetical protein
MSMTNLYMTAAVIIGLVSVLVVKGLEDYSPSYSTTACVNDTCATVTMNKAEMRAACDHMGRIAGRIEPDSPCGRLLGL